MDPRTHPRRPVSQAPGHTKEAGDTFDSIFRSRQKPHHSFGLWQGDKHQHTSLPRTRLGSILVVDQPRLWNAVYYFCASAAHDAAVSFAFLWSRSFLHCSIASEIIDSLLLFAIRLALPAVTAFPTVAALLPLLLYSRLICYHSLCARRLCLSSIDTAIFTPSSDLHSIRHSRQRRRTQKPSVDFAPYTRKVIVSHSNI